MKSFLNLLLLLGVASSVSINAADARAEKGEEARVVAGVKRGRSNSASSSNSSDSTTAVAGDIAPRVIATRLLSGERRPQRSRSGSASF